jgi:hypothetical protein
VQENSWIGGTKLIAETSQPSTANGICAVQLQGPGSKWKTNNESAIEWGGSLGLAMGDIGFDASAYTGHDTSAQIVYGFDNCHAHELRVRHRHRPF